MIGTGSFVCLGDQRIGSLNREREKTDNVPTGTERRRGRDEDFPREKGVRVGGLSWSQSLKLPDSSTPSSPRNQ